jgi:hypothetical protein
MRTPLPLIVLTAVLLAGCGTGGNVPTTTPRVDDDPFPVLRGYGNWIDLAPYGRVWQPNVAAQWRPYVDGQWIWTDRGWMWDTDEPYAWVVYHYGYWTTFGAAGWVWVPDYEWSPARVRWYADGDFIAWAPVPPPRALFPLAYDNGAENVWVIVRADQFMRQNAGRYRSYAPFGPQRAGHPPIGARGPDVRDIERNGGEPVPLRRTERSDIHNGKRTLSRVSIHPVDMQTPPPAPRPVVTPPPARTVPPAQTQPPPPPAAKPLQPTPPPAQKPAPPTTTTPDRRPARTPEARGTDTTTPVRIKPAETKETPVDSVHTKKSKPDQPPRRPQTRERR